jgi:hypothetical protein
VKREKIENRILNWTKITRQQDQSIRSSNGSITLISCPDRYLIVTSCFAREDLIHLKMLQIFYGIGDCHLFQHCKGGQENQHQSTNNSFNEQNRRLKGHFTHLSNAYSEVAIQCANVEGLIIILNVLASLRSSFRSPPPFLKCNNVILTVFRLIKLSVLTVWCRVWHPLRGHCHFVSMAWNLMMRRSFIDFTDLNTVWWHVTA